MPTAKLYDRAKIVKLVKESQPIKYEPSIGDVIFWYDNLNEILFKNELPNLTGVQFCHTKGFWAEAFCERYKKSKKLRAEIKFSYHFESFKDFLEVMAHEMVHIWEFDNFSVMGHGERFFSWEPELRKLGLNISQAK